MKTKISLFIFFSLFSLDAFSGGGSSPKVDYQAGTYTLDNAHTRVSFKIPHFVISKVEGRFNDVKGQITLAEDFSKSSLEGTIDTASAQRDTHLKSADFFDAKKFPKMTFRSTKFEGKKEKFSVIGYLTIKDITKEVKFSAEYFGIVKDPWGNTRAAFKLTANINRKDFNITYDDKFDLGPVVGNEVEISIISEATLNK
jgi:polyisoprenoid-binding protein YceI